VVVILADDVLDYGSIHTHRAIRGRLSTKQGDAITVHSCSDIRNVKRVIVRLVDDTIKTINVKLPDRFSKDLFSCAKLQ
jgi:hypothetical protein